MKKIFAWKRLGSLLMALLLTVSLLPVHTFAEGLSLTISYGGADYTLSEDGDGNPITSSTTIGKVKSALLQGKAQGLTLSATAETLHIVLDSDQLPEDEIVGTFLNYSLLICDHDFQDGKCGKCSYDCTHFYMDHQQIVEGTCIDISREKVTCRVCGYTFTNPGVIDPNNHNWDAGTACDHEGKCAVKRTCQWESTHTDVQIVGDHNWVSGVCSVCNHACTHPAWSDSACTACGLVCGHGGGVNEASGYCASGCGTLLAEAAVNGKYYTLKDALQLVKDSTAGNKATVQIIRDITLKEDLEISEGVFTLDLNGKTVNTDAYRVIISGSTVDLVSTAGGMVLSGHREEAIWAKSGKLTIGKNVTVKTQTRSNFPQNAALEVGAGTVILDGGTITGSGGGVCLSSEGGEGGRFILNSGLVEAREASLMQTVSHAIAGHARSKAILNGGTVRSAAGPAVFTQRSDLEVVGTTLVAGSGHEDIYVQCATDVDPKVDLTKATGSEYTVCNYHSARHYPIEDFTYNAVDYLVESTDTDLSDGGYAIDAIITLTCKHNIMDHVPNQDDTHSEVCRHCGEKTVESCTGGTAVCEGQAECAVCGGKYGQVKSHNMVYTHDAINRTTTYGCTDCSYVEVVFTLVIPTGQIYGDPNMQEPSISCSVEGYTGKYPILDIYCNVGNTVYPEPGNYLAEMLMDGGGIGGTYIIGKGKPTVAKTSRGAESLYGGSINGTASVTGVDDQINGMDAIVYLKKGDTVISRCNTGVVDGVINWATLHMATDGSHVAVGEYTLTYEIQGNDYYDAISGELCAWKVSPRPMSLVAADQTITCGGAISTELSQVTASYLADGQQITAVTLTPSTANVTVDGTVTPSAATIMDGDVDVTANYEIHYFPGKLVIKPDETLLEDLTTDTVTSEDLPAIEEFIEQMENAESTEDTWDDLHDLAEDLADRIEDAAAMADTDVDGLTQDTVRPETGEEAQEIQGELEAAKEQLEKALENFGNNYTDEEEEAIEDELERIEDLLDKLEEVKPFIEAIGDLPEDAEPDDEEAIQKLLDVIDLGNGIPDEARELAGNMDDLLAFFQKLTAYRITMGDGGKYTKGSGKTLSFTANGPAFGREVYFAALFVDGDYVEPENYTVESGSTIAELKNAYLETLEVGEHTVMFVYTFLNRDFETNEATFRVVEKSVRPGGNSGNTNPDTGDLADMTLWLGMMAVSTLGLAGLLLLKKKIAK